MQAGPTNTDGIHLWKIKVGLENRLCYKDGSQISLTSIEEQILMLFLQETNQVLSIEHIYDTVWGYEAIGNPDTVKVHIKNLRQKLEEDYQNTQHIITVRGFGFISIYY